MFQFDTRVVSRTLGRMPLYPSLFHTQCAVFNFHILGSHKAYTVLILLIRFLARVSFPGGADRCPGPVYLAHVRTLWLRGGESRSEAWEPGTRFRASSSRPGLRVHWGPGGKQSSRSEGNRRRVCSWARCPSACVPAHLPGGHLPASTSSIQTRAWASQRMASLELPPARSHILSPPSSTSQQSPAVSRESARPRPPAATAEPGAQEERGG